MTGFLATLCVVLLVLLICAVWALTQAQENVLVEKLEHDQCHEATLAVLKTACRRTDASALRAAADRYDSVEEQNNLRILAQRRYETDGPSMPAIWLREQADKMDPALDPLDLYPRTMEGKRIL